jgi:phosphate transport system protein
MSGRILFLKGLNELRHDILSMASRVEEDLGKAMSALRNSDVALAEEVRADDAAVNALQLKIDDLAAVLIATQQPVARDLRELVGIFKIAGNLERAGDHTAHLANTAVKLSGEPPLRAREHLDAMAETGREMIRESISAYLSQDAGAARRAAAMDDRIDAEHKALTAELLALMRDRPELAEQAIRLLKTSGFLERLGDHITNICEAVIYMIESKHEELN